MSERYYRWRNREIRNHVAVVDGKISPTLLLKNAMYLNVFMKQWIKANIWVYQDRIVYVGDDLPKNQSDTEIVDCAGRYVVPGYVEPHAHPFQLYNPHQFAEYASQTGTTTIVSDNLIWLYLMEQKKAFAIIDELMNLPISMYWWSRFDSQSVLQNDNEKELFKNSNVLDWLNHNAVIQGGELTSWPQLIADDDRILYWMQESKRLGKPVEGHFPGASELTLTKLKLLGASADHEAMTGKEVLARLQLGYHVGLRHSSIRPDLANILQELHELGLQHYEHFTMTTDGSTPSFYENGVISQCIQIAIEQGVPVEDAYMMASFNAAKHFNMHDRLGSIAPGRVAHLNILENKENPNPSCVIAKGKWMKRDGKVVDSGFSVDWNKYGVTPLSLDWELRVTDLQFSIPIGLEMMNDVILKPYPIKIDPTISEIPERFNESFLVLMDRHGTWRVNTLIKGFADKLGGLASSFTTTGDIVLIGKSKEEMMLAWKRMKEIGGGIVLADNGEIIYELPLTLSGMMFDGDMTTLIEKEKQLKTVLKDLGYQFVDPVYNLLFLTSIHLPYIRITPSGIVDVKKKDILFPAIMR